MTFYMADGDQQSGPFSLYELRARGLQPDTLVWREGMAEWQPAASVPQLRALLFGPVIEQEAAVHVMDQSPAEVRQSRGHAPAARSVGTLHYPGSHDAPPPASGMAIASMILGIISIPLSIFGICLWWLSGPCAIIAVILGHLSHNQARRGEAGGGGMAIAGFVCGYVALVISLMFLITFSSLFLRNL